MKKKYCGILFILIFSTISLFAKKVELEDAFLVAKSHINGKNRLKSTQSYDLKLAYTAKGNPALRSSDNQDEPIYYYVFNINENDGYVIISGNDIAVPILGYSFEGSYNHNNLPPGLIYWMGCLQNEIDNAIKENIKQNDETKKQWESYLQKTPATTRSTNSVTLMQTRWNQGGPYNNLCPKIGNAATQTGCVATAMAQIMYYHKCPATTGTGQSTSYTTSTSRIQIPSVNFGATTYLWDDMELNYYSSEYPDKNNAVATLMYHCGVSVEMDYGISASAANTLKIINALPTYFGYDKSIHIKYREYYTDQDWNTILKNEIDEGRPILYSGSGLQTSHIFVCDGYDNEGRFHFNWGWGGLYNDYFATNALYPGGSSYNYSQSIIVNIMPENGGTKKTDIKLYGNYFAFQPTGETSITVGKGEEITINIPFYNIGAANFTGKFGFAIVNQNDDILSVISEYNAVLYSSLRTLDSKSGMIPVDLTPGNYYIRAIAKDNSETDWNIVYGPINSIDKLSVMVDNSSPITHHVNLLDYSFSIPKAIVEQTEEFVVTANFKNNGYKEFNGKLGVALVDENNNILEIIGVFNENITLSARSTYYPGSKDRYCSVSENIPNGNYNVKIVAKQVDEDWTFVSGVPDIQALTVKGTITGLEDTDIKNIIIREDPSSGYLLITSDSKLHMNSVQLFDLFGKKVKKHEAQNSCEIRLPITELSGGIYFLVIQTEKGLITKKILKQ